MAKRKEVQLQADLQTDEDFDRFLELPGLSVIDVYSDWCGPCQGMLMSLRKVKMEQGGDLLNLAIARADSISYLNRFYKKSEPTWLFITEGKSVNIMFGANCPNLMSLINAELKSLNKLATRETYNITEMLPIEIEFDNIKNAAKRAQIQKEIDEKEHKRSEYFYYVTDTIRENLPDIGITLFGPQTTRDAFRHLLDYGLEKYHIQCKDRRNQPITKEQFETINYVCRNPLSPDVIDATDGKEWYISFWKVPDELKEPVPEVLQRFADDVSKPRKLPPDEYRNEEVLPPIITNAKVDIEYELSADEECPKQEEPEPEKAPKKSDTRTESPRGSVVQNAEHQEVMDIEEAESEDEENEGGEGHVDEPKLDDAAIDLGLTDSLLSFGEEEEEIVDDKPKKNICKKIVTIPAVWVPKDKRTHAAIIYTLFRGQTNAFLPPDPVPDPPHVIMAFDTYKKRDLIDFAERNKEDIPFYGFFTSEEAEEAKLIASSKQKYLQSTTAATDKLVFRVNKRTSHTMLSLATYGPTYVSPNTTVGAHEAKIFFPEDYVTAEMEQEQLEALQREENKKKSKKGKPKDETVEEQKSFEKLQAEAAIREAEEADKTAEENVEAKDIKTEGQTEGETEGEGFEGASEGLEGGDIGEGIEVPTEIQPEEPIAVQPEQETQAPKTETTEIVSPEIATTEAAPPATDTVETAAEVPV